MNQIWRQFVGDLKKHEGNMKTISRKHERNMKGNDRTLARRLLPCNSTPPWEKFHSGLNSDLNEAEWGWIGRPRIFDSFRLNGILSDLNEAKWGCETFHSGLNTDLNSDLNQAEWREEIFVCQPHERMPYRSKSGCCILILESLRLRRFPFRSESGCIVESCSLLINDLASAFRLNYWHKSSVI